MSTKLTLTLDDKVIQVAKRLANAEGRSVSELVENFLKSLTAAAKDAEGELTPGVKSLMGSFKAPAGFDYKKTLAAERRRKRC